MGEPGQDVPIVVVGTVTSLLNYRHTPMEMASWIAVVAMGKLDCVGVVGDTIGDTVGGTVGVVGDSVGGIPSSTDGFNHLFALGSKYSTIQRCFLTGDQRFSADARIVKVKKEQKTDKKKKKADLPATLRAKGGNWSNFHQLKDKDSKAICYNWSSGGTCAKSPCTFAHSCFNCRSTDGHKGCGCTDVLFVSLTA